MGYLYSTLILTKNKIESKGFLLNFHNNLKSIDVQISKDDDNYLIYNDSDKDDDQEEKEPINVSKFNEEEIINLITNCSKLGQLEYYSEKQKFYFTISYYSKDKKVTHLAISINNSLIEKTDIHKTYLNIVLQIISFLEYELVISKSGLLDFDFDPNESVDKIKERIIDNPYDIYLRNPSH